MLRITAVIFPILLVGCAQTSPITNFNSGEPHFRHPTELIKNNIDSKDIYRIYHRAATGFVSIQSIRDDAERRANDFCERQDKKMLTLGEQTSHPPYILGNFPRIEICFACIAKKTGTVQLNEPRTDIYAEILKFDDLRKKGLITDEEFEFQKRKLLNPSN